MSRQTLFFVAPVMLVTALTAQPVAQAPEQDRGTIAAGVAGGASCGPASYNRRVDQISFRPDSTGGTEITLAYSLRVGDSAGAASDLSADILVEIIVSGVVVSSTTIGAEYGFLANDAVTCAVSCASPCGSIFGDGVCAGCDCDYSRSATLPGIVLAHGDRVKATILPLPTAAPELHTDDDELEVIFGSARSCCPWDFDRDGMVGIVDFLELLARWGPCP